MSKWRVATDKDLTFFDTPEQFQATLTTPREKREKGSKVASTLFPPPNAKELHLERRSVFRLNCRCFISDSKIVSMRIYPHMQDTGGFFVAVLERVGEPSARSYLTESAQ
jgi:multisite-specific tRNA:(cytosine-C5)-methyltransferase